MSGAESGSPRAAREGVNVHIEADIFLPWENVWPDNDAPAQPSTDDVVKLVRDLYGDWKLSGMRQWLNEWNLLDDLDADIDGKQVWP